MKLSSSDLAKALGVSAARVSQYVAEGKLEGCYTGHGRARRFDLDKAAEALGRRLDAGQMMGNGAQTAAALARLRVPVSVPGSAPAPRRDGALAEDDEDRYRLARMLKAEEETRALRRRNAEAEGLFVLASEAQITAAKAIAQEVAEFESFLRTAARHVADEMGLDYKSVRSTLMTEFREHRGRRAENLRSTAAAAELTPAERDADI